MIGKACARACFNYSATNHLHHYHLLKRWPREDNGLRKSRIICRSSSSSSIGINLHCTANTMPCSRHHQCTRVLCLTCLLVNDICVCAVDKVCAPCSCVDGSTKDITTLGRSSSTLLTADSFNLSLRAWNIVSKGDWHHTGGGRLLGDTTTTTVSIITSAEKVLDDNGGMRR